MAKSRKSRFARTLKIAGLALIGMVIVALFPGLVFGAAKLIVWACVTACHTIVGAVVVALGIGAGFAYLA
jgi:hypothetical protein